MKKNKINLKFPSSKFFVENKNPLLVVLFCVIVFAVFYFYKGLFISATVNGRPITRIQVIKDLEKRSGAQALDAIITQTVLDQEATKNGIKITSQDIDNELNKIRENLKAQGQDLDQVIASQGMTEQDVRDQLILQIKLERLLADKLTVSDTEVEEFITTNASFIPEEEKNKPNFKETIVEQVKRQKMSELGQTYIEELKQKSQINYLNN